MFVIARIDFGFWLRRIVTWDGVLPVMVWLAPSAVEVVLPNRREAIEIAAVVLPITAVFVRFRAGVRHIASNECSRLVRGVQVAVFMVGLLPLILVDCFEILSHVIPAAGPMPAEDVVVWLVLLSIYLTAMTIAMYPGRMTDDYRVSIESSDPRHRGAPKWQPPWVFAALMITCIICGAWAAGMARPEPTRNLVTLVSLVSGAAALAIAIRTVQMRVISRKSHNDSLDRRPTAPASAPSPAPAKAALPLHP